MNLEFAEYLSDDELSKIAPMLDRLSMLEKQKASQDKYIDFVKRIWPSFIEGRHHKIYADKLQQKTQKHRLNANTSTASHILHLS